MKYLIVVDMQNDFITGSLGSKLAEMIVPNVVEKVKNYEGTVIFTRDTHFSDYMKTQEGKNLPVQHCIKDTTGWEICNELKPYSNKVIDKITFGSVDLPNVIKEYGEEIEEIELCGLCTDICVISKKPIPIFCVIFTAFRSFRVRNRCFRMLLQALFPRSPKL